jgi:hypothetical protein
MIVGGVIAVALLAGFATTFFGRGAASEAQNKQEIPTAAKVGSTVVDVESISNAISTTRQSISGVEIPEPLQEVQIATQAVATAVNTAVSTELSKKYGVVVDDAAIQAELNRQIDEQISMWRMEMTMMKKLKDGATESEFEQVLKKEGRIRDNSLADWRKSITESIGQRPELQARMRTEAARNLVLEKFKNEAKLSDADLKASMASLTVKRVFIPEGVASPVAKDPKVAITEAEAELKKGTPFEDVVAKYSKDPVPTGKSIKDSTQTFVMSQAYSDSAFAPMKGLKVGQVSPVMNVEGGFALYKVIKIEPNVPADFEKQKEGQRTSLANQIAQRRLADEMKTFESGAAITWTDTGAQALYLMNQAFSSPTPDNKKLEEVLKLPSPGDSFGRQWYSLARYGAMSLIWSKLSEADKKKRADEKLMILQEVVSVTDGPTLRLDIADVLRMKKDPAAGQELSLAARNNTGFGPNAQRSTDEITKRIPEFMKDGVLSAETKAAIEKTLTEWRASKKQADDALAQQAAEMERQRKENEAAVKKAEEEAKKAAGTQKMGGGGNVNPGGAAPPSSNSLNGSAAPAAPAPAGP